MAALGTIMFVWAWNQYLWPLLVTTDAAHCARRSMELRELIPARCSASPDWNIAMAGTLIIMLPPLLVVDPDAALVRARPDRDREVRSRPAMADITLRGVRKSYGKTEVVHGVDLDISDGEFVVILGPSGCGKSTLLRMIAGLEEITGGEIAIGGRSSTSWSRASAAAPWCSRTMRSIRI